MEDGRRVAAASPAPTISPRRLIKRAETEPHPSRISLGSGSGATAQGRAMGAVAMRQPAGLMDGDEIPWKLTRYLLLRALLVAARPMSLIPCSHGSEEVLLAAPALRMAAATRRDCDLSTLGGLGKGPPRLSREKERGFRERETGKKEGWAAVRAGPENGYRWYLPRQRLLGQVSSGRTGSCRRPVYAASR